MTFYDESLPPGLILGTGEDETGEHAGQERPGGPTHCFRHTPGEHHHLIATPQRFARLKLTSRESLHVQRAACLAMPAAASRPKLGARSHRTFGPFKARCRRTV